MNPKSTRHWFSRVALTAVAVLAVAGSVGAQDPVEVSFEVTGTAVPGGMVDVTATATINDGSTLQSYSWAQVGGADVGLSGTATKTVTVMLP